MTFAIILFPCSYINMSDSKYSFKFIETFAFIVLPLFAKALSRPTRLFAAVYGLSEVATVSKLPVGHKE